MSPNKIIFGLLQRVNRLILNPYMKLILNKLVSQTFYIRNKIFFNLILFLK